MSKDKIVNLYRLEKNELARIIVINSSEFRGVAEFLDKKYEKVWRKSDWLCRQEKRIAREFIRDLLAGISKVLRDVRDVLHEIACVKLKWCEMREKASVEIASSLAAALVSKNFGEYSGELAMFLIKHGVLNRLCKCS